MPPIIKIIFFLCFVTNSIISQTKKIDSLQLLLKTSSDSAGIKLLLALSDEYTIIGKMEKVNKYLNIAENNAFLKTNVYFQNLVQYKRAFYLYRLGSFQKSLELARQGYLIAKQINNTTLQGDYLKIIGMNSGRLGEFKKALENYHLALKQYEKTKDITGEINIYSNIAGIYYDQFDYKNALEYFKKVLEMALLNNDKKMVGNTYNNIGSTLHNMNLISEARTYYLKAIQTNKDANNVILLGTNYSNLSECELTENNFAKAHEYNDESIKIFESYSDNYNIVGSLNVKADIFIKEKKYKNGLNVLLYSLSFAEKTGSPLVKQRTYIKIAEAFELVDDYKQATRFYKKYNVTRDSIINSEIRENVTKKQLTFEFDKKRLSDSIETISKEKYLKQEIEISKKSVKQQKYITYISLISLIIVTLLAFFIYKGYKKNKLANVIIENQKKIAEQKNKEILASIYYASRIQKASLPNDKYIDRKIKDLNKNKKL